MQPERRALIVAAHLEPTEPGDRFLTAIDVQVLHRATEILDPFGGDFDVVDTPLGSAAECEKAVVRPR
jgi:hypothetical protein